MEPRELDRFQHRLDREPENSVGILLPQLREYFLNDGDADLEVDAGAHPRVFWDFKLQYPLREFGQMQEIPPRIGALHCQRGLDPWRRNPAAEHVAHEVGGHVLVAAVERGLGRYRRVARRVEHARPEHRIEAVRIRTGKAQGDVVYKFPMMRDARPWRFFTRG